MFNITFTVENPCKVVDILWCSTHDVDSTLPKVKIPGISKKQTIDFLNHFVPIYKKANKVSEPTMQRPFKKRRSKSFSKFEYDTDEDFYHGASESESIPQKDIENENEILEEAEVVQEPIQEEEKEKEDMGDCIEEFSHRTEQDFYGDNSEIIGILNEYPEKTVRTKLPPGNTFLLICQKMQKNTTFLLT